MRQQDASSHRYIYSSISVQLIDQCMLQAAVARESSSPPSRINKLLLLYYEPVVDAYLFPGWECRLHLS